VYDLNLWQSRIYGTLHRSLVVLSCSVSECVLECFICFRTLLPPGTEHLSVRPVIFILQCIAVNLVAPELHCTAMLLTSILNYVTLNGRRFMNDGEREWESSQRPKLRIWT
jgi:hypothetical protein